MKMFPMGACGVLFMTCLAWVPQGGGEPPPKAKAHPFPDPPGMLNLRGLEAGFGERKNFIMSLLYDPLLSATDKVPIGVFIQTLKNQIGLPNGAGAGSTPNRLCAFEGLIWTLVDQFGYSARALVGRDQSLAGFSFRVWNNSRTHPLTFTLNEHQPLFLAYASIDDQEYSNRPKNAAGRAADLGKEVEWTLKPRESRAVFVSMRSLLPEGFRPDEAKECHFSVYSNMHPKDVPKTMEPQFPGISGFSARISAEGLAMDIQEAIKEADANTPDNLKKK